MKKEDCNKPIFVSRAEVGSLFKGLNKKTLANLLHLGKGPQCFKNGRKIYYRVSDLEAWLTQCPIKTFDMKGDDI